MASPQITIRTTPEAFAQTKAEADKKGMTVARYIATVKLKWPLVKKTGRPKKEKAS